MGFNRMSYPWRRFLARLFDYALFFILILPVTIPIKGEIHSFFSAMMFYLLYVPIEAFQICVVGTTIGKFLLGLKIVTLSGSPISYWIAFRRGLLVFFRGIGLGIPVVAPIFIIFAYSKLEELGSTSWDRDLGLVVVG